MSEKTMTQAATAWKDHHTTELVGQLTGVAREFHATQQLRERIAGVVRPLADRLKAAQHEPATAPGELVRIFREYLTVHPGIELDGYAKDTMALELARIALAALVPDQQEA